MLFRAFWTSATTHVNAGIWSFEEFVEAHDTEVTSVQQWSSVLSSIRPSGGEFEGQTGLYPKDAKDQSINTSNRRTVIRTIKAFLSTNSSSNSRNHNTFADSVQSAFQYLHPSQDNYSRSLRHQIYKRIVQRHRCSRGRIHLSPFQRRLLSADLIDGSFGSCRDVRYGRGMEGSVEGKEEGRLGI